MFDKKTEDWPVKSNQQKLFSLTHSLPIPILILILIPYPESI